MVNEKKLKSLLEEVSADLSKSEDNLSQVRLMVSKAEEETNSLRSLKFSIERILELNI